jgi:undecaprenyl-diphosphatase
METGLAAIALGVLTGGGSGRDLDRRLFRVVNGNVSPRRDRAFKAVTELGSIWASAGAAAVLAARGRRRAALDAIGAAATMWLVGQAVKRMFVRPRPYEALPDVRLLIHPPRGSSWPSSHPAVLLAFFVVASKGLGVPLRFKAALAALVGAVGISRVYLGVHYPADVAGGMLLGTAVADLWADLISPTLLGLRSHGAAGRLDF